MCTLSPLAGSRRVIKSEMAYSETQALLDQTKTKLENLQDDCKSWFMCNKVLAIPNVYLFSVESQKMQVSTVIHEMQNNTESLTSLKTQKKAVEEVRLLQYCKASTVFVTSSTKLHLSPGLSSIRCLQYEVLLESSSCKWWVLLRPGDKDSIVYVLMHKGFLSAKFFLLIWHLPAFNLRNWMQWKQRWALKHSLLLLLRWFPLWYAQNAVLQQQISFLEQEASRATEGN